MEKKENKKKMLFLDRGETWFEWVGGWKKWEDVCVCVWNRRVRKVKDRS